MFPWAGSSMECIDNCEQSVSCQSPRKLVERQFGTKHQQVTTEPEKLSSSYFGWHDLSHSEAHSEVIPRVLQPVTAGRMRSFAGDILRWSILVSSRRGGMKSLQREVAKVGQQRQ